MAGERKGITYEAIVKIALDRLSKQGVLKGDIFWNQKPNTMTIEPDLTVGTDKDSPTHLFLITHSGVAGNSHMKFWRNIGELVEAKVRLPTTPYVYSIAFDAAIKEDLKALQLAAFDGQLVIGDSEHGRQLQIWVDKYSGTLPKSGIDKVAAINSYIADESSSGSLGFLIGELTDKLCSLVSASRPELDSLWRTERSRVRSPAPPARHTSVKRGFTKAALLASMGLNPNHLPKVLPNLLSELGLVGKSIVGYKVIDQDLLWLQQSSLASISASKLLASIATSGFCQQLSKVQATDLIDQFLSYVDNNLDVLKTSSGMAAALRNQRIDPTEGIITVEGVAPPSSVWLFDTIAALVKAKSGQAQAFGYSSFTRHPKAATFRVGKMDVGSWVSCFINQYFSRKKGFCVAKEVEDFVAEVLSDSLREFTPTDVHSAATAVREQYIAKQYEATLLSHRGFDPIFGIISACTEIQDAKQERIRGFFAERVLSGGSAGSTGVIRVRNTILNWQSVTDSGRDHKKKELCGRAMSIRYSWDAISEKYVPRPGVAKLILILDGTWRQEDLDSLVSAGWDEIFYPDEMDKLVKAIV